MIIPEFQTAEGAVIFLMSWGKEVEVSSWYLENMARAIVNGDAI